jgi:hypothetical protein
MSSALQRNERTFGTISTSLTHHSSSINRQYKKINRKDISNKTSYRSTIDTSYSMATYSWSNISKERCCKRLLIHLLLLLDLLPLLYMVEL